jgi:serine/threonine protein kinase
VYQSELTGRVLDGKYVLGPVIGRGAIGRVYKARQLSLEREVAVKILNPGYTNHPEAVARFRLEAQAASRIRHPGIVTILDWGKDVDGLLYLVIEYLGGRDLFDVAQKEAPLDSPRIARLMQQVAMALGHAHGEGIIHRDLKPENLRVLEDPIAPIAHRERVKIYDFGVAHVTRGLTRVFTQVGVLVGTPYYMSPEQASSVEVLPQSDLYSCGIIMYLLATGTLPFVAPSPVDVAAMHLKKRPLRPSVLNPEIDPRLERIIMRCLAKDPWRRPASGAELAAMLDPIASTPTSHLSTEVAGELGQRRSSPWLTAWAIGATAASVAIGAAHFAHGSPGITAATDARCEAEFRAPMAPADIARPLEPSGEPIPKTHALGPSSHAATQARQTGELDPHSRDPVDPSHSALLPSSPVSDEKL